MKEKAGRNVFLRLLLAVLLFMIIIIGCFLSVPRIIYADEGDSISSLWQINIDPFMDGVSDNEFKTYWNYGSEYCNLDSSKEIFVIENKQIVGENYMIPDDPKPLICNGKYLEGWYTEQNGQGIKITEELLAQNSEINTFYANWKDTVWVDFYTDNSSCIVDSIEEVPGYEWEFPEVNPEYRHERDLWWSYNGNKVDQSSLFNCEIPYRPNTCKLEHEFKYKRKLATCEYFDVYLIENDRAILKLNKGLPTLKDGQEIILADKWNYECNDKSLYHIKNDENLDNDELPYYEITIDSISLKNDNGKYVLTIDDEHVTDNAYIAHVYDSDKEISDTRNDRYVGLGTDYWSMSCSWINEYFCDFDCIELITPEEYRKQINKDVLSYKPNYYKGTIYEDVINNSNYTLGWQTSDHIDFIRIKSISFSGNTYTDGYLMHINEWPSCQWDDKYLYSDTIPKYYIDFSKRGNGPEHFFWSTDLKINSKIEFGNNDVSLAEIEFSPKGENNCHLEFDDDCGPFSGDQADVIIFNSHGGVQPKKITVGADKGRIVNTTCTHGCDLNSYHDYDSILFVHN